MWTALEQVMNRKLPSILTALHTQLIYLNGWFFFSFFFIISFSYIFLTHFLLPVFACTCVLFCPLWNRKKQTHPWSHPRFYVYSLNYTLEPLFSASGISNPVSMSKQPVTLSTPPSPTLLPPLQAGLGLTLSIKKEKKGQATEQLIRKGTECWGSSTIYISAC